MKTDILMGGGVILQSIIIIFAIVGFSYLESEKLINFFLSIVCLEIILVWSEVMGSNGLKLTDNNLVVYNFFRGDIYSIDYCDIDYIIVITMRGLIFKIHTNYGERKKYSLSILGTDDVIDYLRKNGVEVKVKEWRW